ncbi:hypothetical protein Hanom_Chr09g00780101 [Helianthus anomalus]
MRGRPSRLVPSPSHQSEHFQHLGESHSSQPTRHSVSHHSSHSQHSHYSYFHSYHDSFDPNQYINSPPPSYNKKDNDSDPEMPPSGTNLHPIGLSSDTTSFAGSPYQGPDGWDQYFNQFTFYNTPEHKPQTPSYPPFQTPPPPQEDEPMEQQQAQLRKPRTGARMLVRAGKWSGSLPPFPQPTQLYQRTHKWVDPPILNLLLSHLNNHLRVMITLFLHIRIQPDLILLIPVPERIILIQHLPMTPTYMQLFITLTYHLYLLLIQILDILIMDPSIWLFRNHNHAPSSSS